MNMLGDYIKLKRGNMSVRELAKQCGISHTHLDSIEKGKDFRTKKPVRITTETLQKIAIGIKEDVLFLTKLSLNINTTVTDAHPVYSPNEQELIMKYRKLTPDMQQLADSNINGLYNILYPTTRIGNIYYPKFK